jgi:Kef-type K+ transport system membrane component KefB
MREEMDHFDVPQQIGCLALILIAAKVSGGLARWLHQPAVLGELLAGVVLGGSVLGLVDPSNSVLHFLAEIGVILLLFHIGVETDLKQLLQVGGASTTVAIVGVVLPFALGYAVCRLLGVDNLVAIVAGATLTATSVGITARVLSDLGRLREPESQMILGAAVIDDIIGLIILTVVTGLTQGKEVTASSVAFVSSVAFGFLLAALLFGRLVVPSLLRWAERLTVPGTLPTLAFILALGMAWTAHQVGSALIIGAFAAGLIVAGVPQAREVEHGVAHLAHFFVPVFFVMVGTVVDVHVFNPFEAGNHGILLVGGLLIVAAVVGKFLAGYAPFWFRGRKSVVGVGMIPRGEVGLIFAQMGQSTGVFDSGMFSAVTLMVIVTTFIAPPLLQSLFRASVPPSQDSSAAGEDLVNEP